MDESSDAVNKLAKSCATSSDPDEWERFLGCCMPMASLVALSVARQWKGAAAPAIVEDIVQEIFLKLCEQERRILREFKPRGEDSFLGLLRIISASVASDYFRRQHSAKRGGRVVTSSLDEPASPTPAAADQTPDMHKSVLFAELDGRLRSAPEVIGQRDRAIFWLYYLQGFTAEEIARLPAVGLSSKGVESALRRISQWLRHQLERPTPQPGSEPVEEQGV